MLNDSWMSRMYGDQVTVGTNEKLLKALMWFFKSGVEINLVRHVRRIDAISDQMLLLE